MKGEQNNEGNQHNKRTGSDRPLFSGICSKRDGLYIRSETEQSCKNVIALLEAAGSGAEKVIKTTCFLAEIADFAAFNEVYAKYFISKPARSCVAVKDLPKGALCEIECIAEA